jgi:putative OPT family oligopeptide transporter
VDATPWRQQFALVVGVFCGALVIPPILALLNDAYGFAGAPALHAAATAQPLPAPQATLISALAKGVIGGQLDWSLLGIGALLGIAIIVADEALRALSGGKFKLPPLAVGLGIYLPAATTAPVVVGAVLGYLYNRRATSSPDPGVAQRLGVLLASGLIVGESLFGVALAGVIVFSGNGSPLALVGDSFAIPGEVVGTIAFAIVSLGLYAWVGRLAKRVEVEG